MPSERIAKALLDIKDNIVLARTWTAEISAAEFSENRMAFYTVTRCLEIISEATRRLPADLRHRHPHIPRRDIGDAGNVYRHAYDGVQERIVLETVRGSLPHLEVAIDDEIARV